MTGEKGAENVPSPARLGTDVLPAHNLGTNREEERETNPRAWPGPLTAWAAMEGCAPQPQTGFRMSNATTASEQMGNKLRAFVHVYPLKMNCAKMINHKLIMEFVTDEIKDNFKLYLLVVWSEDNSEKLISHCRIFGGTDMDDDGIGTIEGDIFCINRRT